MLSLSSGSRDVKVSEYSVPLEQNAVTAQAEPISSQYRSSYLFQDPTHDDAMSNTHSLHVSCHDDDCQHPTHDDPLHVNFRRRFSTLITAPFVDKALGNLFQDDMYDAVIVAVFGGVVYTNDPAVEDDDVGAITRGDFKAKI